jgi:hypothetical protein
MRYRLKWTVAGCAIAGLAAALPAQAQNRRPASPTPPPAQAQAPAPTKFASGKSWVNEDGSVLAITTVTPSGLINGTFTTRVGCGAGKAQPLTGWYYAGPDGGAVTFSVNWEGCDSVTSWSGQYSEATGQFQALWHLAVASAPVWNGIVAGSNFFVPQKPADKK